jgi:hypothetical protein
MNNHKYNSKVTAIFATIIYSGKVNVPELADRLNYHVSTIYRWADGEYALPANLLPKIAKSCYQNAPLLVIELFRALMDGTGLIPVGDIKPTGKPGKDIQKEMLDVTIPLSRLHETTLKALEDGYISSSERAEICRVFNDLKKEVSEIGEALDRLASLTGGL